MKDIEIYKSAVQKWGTELQFNMVIEECAELIKAVSKVKRGKAKDLFNLIEEITDVEIMLGQAKYIVDTVMHNAPWERVKKEKLDHIQRMLDES